MDNTKNLKIVFTGDTASVVAAFDAVQKKSTETQAKTKTLSDQLDSLGGRAKSVGGEFQSLGGTLTKSFTIPLVGLGIAAGKMAMDFQQNMTYIRTDAGDTTDNINQLSQSVLDLARTSQFSPDQLSQGLYHLASLGLRGADAMNALNTAQQMASVGGADLESTSSALGAALVTGIKGVQDYSQAAGVLDATIGAGNMRMQDLVNALGTGALTVFKNAGLSIVDFGSALATLTDNGMQADEAATRLKMTISLMEAPSKKARDALAAVGMTSNQLGMDMQTKGLIPALEDLQKHLLDTYGTTAEGKQKIAQALTEMFGGGRSSAAIQTLLDQLDRVQNKENQISTQSGEFASKVAEQQQTASAKMKTAWSSVQADLIELGGTLLPAVANAFTVLTHDIDKATQWWNSLSQAQQHDIEKLGEILIVGGPVLSLFGKFIGTFGTLMKIGSVGTSIFAKLFGGLAGASEGATGLAAVTGEATAATGAVSGLATTLLGPVGLALAGTAILAGGAYLAYRKWTDDGIKPAQPELTKTEQLAKDLGYTFQSTSSTVGMLTLAEKGQKEASDMVDLANQKVKASTDSYKNSLQDAKAKADDVKTAQDKVKQALDQFGQNSPQYQQAVNDLKKAEDDYNQSLLNSWSNSVSLKTAEDNLTTAHGVLKGAIQDLKRAQDILNNGIDSGVQIIGRFGPTALAQVAGVDTLQNHLSIVVGTFHDFQGSLQSQLPNMDYQLQGLGSTIGRLQDQSSALNGSLQHASVALQGGSVSLQGSAGHNATGTDYWMGGKTWINEEGPELVNLPRGSQVIPASETKQVMQNSGGDVHIHVNAGTVVGSNGMSELADTIYRTLQQRARANGFLGALPNIGISPLG